MKNKSNWTKCLFYFFVVMSKQRSYAWKRGSTDATWTFSTSNIDIHFTISADSNVEQTTGGCYKTTTNSACFVGFIVCFWGEHGTRLVPGRWYDMVGILREKHPVAVMMIGKRTHDGHPPLAARWNDVSGQASANHGCMTQTVAVLCNLWKVLVRNGNYWRILEKTALWKLQHHT